MSEWKEYKLGDVLEIKYGKDHKGLSNGKIPCLGSGGIMRFVDKSIYDNESILIPRKGTLNNIMYQNKPFWTVDTMFWSKLNQSQVNGKYLFYQLTLIDYTNLNVGSAVPSLTVPVINDIDILLPPLPEQTAIASVLSSLDDKIDLLNRQNATLEKMAETLFRQWFVEEAKEDWEVVTLGDYISVKHGFAFKGEFISPEPTNLKLVTPGNFKIGGGFKSDKFKYYTKEDFPLEYIFKTNDLIVTMTDLSVDGDTLGYSALIPENYKDEIYLHNQRVGKIVFKRNISKYFIYYLMKTDDYQWFILSGASGTSIRHTSPTSICSYEFKLPLKQTMDKFENICSDLQNKIRINTTQIRTLTALRDTLLPKLMSGEVKVAL